MLSTGTAAGGDLTGTYPNPTIAALAVTTAKHAVGASINGAVLGTFPVSFSSATVGAFVTVLTLPALTTRGGWVLLTGGPGASFTATSAASILYVQLTRNGAAVQAWRYDAQSVSTGNTKFFMPAVCWMDNPAAGAQTYAYQIYQTVGNTFITAADNAGALRAVELA